MGVFVLPVRLRICRGEAMKSQIDNFEIAANKLLQFDMAGEFYLVLVLKRRKDTKGGMVEGVNEGNRLIKHYFIYDKDYLLRKEAAIKQLCEQNNARAYILPQRRSHDLVMWALHNKTGEVLKSGAKNTHFDHLIRSCVAGMHEVPPDAKWHKRWVIDIDRDDERTAKLFEESRSLFMSQIVDYPSYDEVWYRFVCHILGKVKDLFRKKANNGLSNNEAWLKMTGGKSRVGNTEMDVTLLETPHGWHIVCPPFNREEKACKEYFEGFWNNDWVKTDAMALLFAPSTIS